MYDIEFQLAVTKKTKYFKRLLDFKKYGLVNIKDKKVMVKLLPGIEDIPPEGIRDWPCDVDVIKNGFNSSHEVPKLYHYYASLTEQAVSNARWFAKIDDDSITDVAGLVNNLDAYYDHEKDYYLITVFGTTAEEHKFDNTLASALGYNWWFAHGEDFFPEHEVEMSIASQSTMRKIINNKISQTFLEKRAKIGDGFSDVALAYAARMCKIYCVKAPFITHEPNMANFSLLDGKLNHIHWVAHDVNHKLFHFFQNFINNTICTKEQWKILENKDFYIYDANNVPLEKIIFQRNGKIGLSEVYKFWYAKKDSLIIFNEDASKGNVMNYRNFGDAFFGKNISVRSGATDICIL